MAHNPIRTEQQEWITICQQVAQLYTQCMVDLEGARSSVAMGYYDWSDHIAGQQGEYLFHLSKCAEDIQTLAPLLGKGLSQETYQAWANDWLACAICAGWVHDIGMIYNRNDHGRGSAQFVLSKNPHFDFEGIPFEARLKIALLCLKHNKRWTEVYRVIKQLLENEDGLYWVEKHFNARTPRRTPSPTWELDFSGKLISAADSLRYRGKSLKNNFGDQFALVSQCPKCQQIAAWTEKFCPCGEEENSIHAVVPLGYQWEHCDKSELPLLDSNNTVNYNSIFNKKHEFIAFAQADSEPYTIGDMGLTSPMIRTYEDWVENCLARGLAIPDLPQDRGPWKINLVCELQIDQLVLQEALECFFQYLLRFFSNNMTWNGVMESEFFTRSDALLVVDIPQIQNHERLKELLKKTASKQDYSTVTDIQDILETSINSITSQSLLYVKLGNQFKPWPRLVE